MKPSSLLILALVCPVTSAAGSDLRQQAEATLQRGLAFFRTLHVEGGYGYYVTPDGSRRWGEEPLESTEIEVQPPGTPAVGQSFLRAYRATGDPHALAGARAAADALIRGQNRHGGWDHTINFSDLENDTVSFDDNQSQSAISFLMALDQVVDDDRLTAAVQRALTMMVATQLPSGGWPHLYPARGNYHDYATFNDAGINDCVRVMLEARRQYGEDEKILRSLRQVARFMMISQLPPPQPGWAQQYNEYLQPAWARSFEPPAVCPAETVRNIQTLIDLYLVLHDETLLEPVPDALRWVRAVRLENGKWARFVELGTNRPLYYDRGRIRVESTADLHVERRTGYGYETDLAPQLEAATRRYEDALRLGAAGLHEHEQAPLAGAPAAKRVQRLAETVREIIAAQEASGAWITRNDPFRKTLPRGVRWNGEYEESDRISSFVFNRNVAVLCEFIELSDRLARTSPSASRESP
jgi:hypothetical protein